MEQTLVIDVGTRAGSVDAILLSPANPRLLYVLAHGAGAGMQHPFMAEVAGRFYDAGIATLRYQFPYLQSGGRRPDPPALLEATVRAAILLGQSQLPDVPLVAGGKSMGGRMTSQLLSRDRSLPVSGLVFLGFPLHQPGKPSRTRAQHLFDVTHPMLFLQGTRDTLADLELMQEVTDELGTRARLHVVDGADHSFAVLKRSGRTHDDVMNELADETKRWAAGLT